MHAHHLHTQTHTHNPPFSPIQIPSSSAHFPPPPHTLRHQSHSFSFTSPTHSFPPSNPPAPSLHCHPPLALVSPPDPPILTTPTRFALRGPRVQEQKGKSGDFLQRQSNRNAEWNKKKKSKHCAVWQPQYSNLLTKFQEQVTSSTSRSWKIEWSPFCRNIPKEEL